MLSSARRLLLLSAFLVAAAIGLPSPVAAGSAPQTEFDRILTIATAQLGDRYSASATGPRQFDCSGFVYFVYKEAGLLDRIGGSRRTVAGLHHYWKKNNLPISRTLDGAQPGDLLVWGNDHHTGIYVGNGYAISALVNPWGVTRHKVVGWLRHMKLTAVLHVNLGR